ncbi:methyl-accepting chemotaxis protein [Paenibacillus pasadenensis]|uniref:methyl-accepting chemotaxis protein n=1 Tax=Paenibacillus pasadenensis TaxID=217090 RepID=UPI0020409FBF|nr:methyl-accepting chemotaxis protein [Paenibacillus pasadenensis]MCM3748450.1 methyl-accepting chemotaxis protein [Paenibacillus pasadenensis]
MFDWLGFRTGLPLWVSCRLNRNRIGDVKEIFEGIAATRAALLQDWAAEYWGHMGRLRQRLEQEAGERSIAEFAASEAGAHFQLEEAYRRAVHFTELFFVDGDGAVTATTYAPHLGQGYELESRGGLELGLSHASSSGGRCLYGPFRDEITLAAGPRTSSFHDRVTLMFIEPFFKDGKWLGALCGRVPGDVLGDLIQRESGHVYPDSGDNYLFMAKPELDLSIEPGVALSRSRFEDRTFTHGDNLKDGVRTDYGIVKVEEHTELELKFTDPSTGELHPGVANTIRSGSNLFVEFPGYSDYRHIPVIGKGVTFRLPHHPDLWGMMCEGDLEEVYRIRGIDWQTRRSTMLSLFVSVPLFALLMLALVLMESSAAVVGAVAVGAYTALGIVVPMLSRRRITRRTAERLGAVTRFIRLNAEGGGDLTQRLRVEDYGQDETRELAKWINNMIDSLEGIMLRVRLASGDVRLSQGELSVKAVELASNTERVGEAMGQMIAGTASQLKDIEGAKASAFEMRQQLQELEEQANREIGVARSEVERIGEAMHDISRSMEQSGQKIGGLVGAVNQVREVLGAIEQISSQTHLLALNASIEAARAGESGRGFAVVAGEIRKLSELTRQSTESVRNIIAQIYEEMERTTASMEEGGQAVESGRLLVEAASGMLMAAAAGDGRKQEVAGEVARLMERIAEVSLLNRETSAKAELHMQELQREMARVKATAGEAEAITGLLEGMVAQFRLTESRRSG